MQLRLYLRMLQRGWWLIALAALAALNIALLLSYLSTPMYRTSARFIIMPNATLDDNRDILSSLGTLDRRSIAATYAEVMMSERVYENAQMGVLLPPEKLADYERTAVVLPDANVLELTISGSDPATTAALANGIGEQTIDFIHEFYEVYDIDFLDRAPVPTSAFRPNPARDAAVALVVGAVVGAILAILREQLHIPLTALRQRQSTDQVSGALSRTALIEQLEAELHHYGPGKLSLGLIYLYGLEDLQETLPTNITTILLRRVSKTITNEIRGRDLVGRWDTICFAVVFSGMSNLAANYTIKHLHTILSYPQHIDRGEDELLLDPHVAVVTYQADEKRDEFIERAEEALRQASLAARQRPKNRMTGPAPTSAASQTQSDAVPHVSKTTA